ncbi:MAG TPA: hypothetical protein VMU99_07945 [Acidimicrobiales bacterium]|nr:hypothetical protein [Acidimicrobiales bacterium]
MFAPAQDTCPGPSLDLALVGLSEVIAHTGGCKEPISCDLCDDPGLTSKSIVLG